MVSDTGGSGISPSVMSNKSAADISYASSLRLGVGSSLLLLWLWLGDSKYVMAYFSAPVTSVPPPKELDKKFNKFRIPIASARKMESPASITVPLGPNATTRQYRCCLCAAWTHAKTIALDIYSLLLSHILYDVSKQIMIGPPRADGVR